MAAETELAHALRQLDKKLTVEVSDKVEEKPTPQIEKSQPEKSYQEPVLHVPTPPKKTQIHIDPDNAEKTQWNKVLSEFCGQSIPRQRAALKRLRPSELSNLIELATEAKEAVNEAVLEHYIQKIEQDGFTLEQLLQFKENHKPTPVHDKQRPNQKMPPDVHQYIKDTWSTVEPKGQLEYIKKEFDYEVKKQTLYSLRSVFKKEAEKAANKK